MTGQEKLDFLRALDLLREIRVQEFISDNAWDIKELRRWIRKTDSLLDKHEVAK